MKKIVLLFFAVLLLASCSRKNTGAVTTIARDTIYINKTNTQLVYSHDTTFVDRWHTEKEYVKGDTVFVWRIDSTSHNHISKVHDTLRVTDTLYRERVEVQQVPVKKKGKWWLWLLIGSAIPVGLYTWVKLR